MGGWSGWNSPKVPNTIGKKKGADLQRRAARSANGSIMNGKAAKQRKLANANKKNSWWN
jgi:hypothetical protein